uniref:PDZ domain-containing protein n=1 Tax=Panagrellus redivivus TaxID=6233 RepID=A0A7E4UZQ7_PANRE
MSESRDTSATTAHSSSVSVDDAVTAIDKLALTSNGCNGALPGPSSSDADAKSDAASSEARSVPRTNGSGSTVSANVTKIVYHVDDESMPYVTEVPVAPDRVTLLDFKKMLNKLNYKYYCKSNDPEVGGEVKAEIRDDNQQLFRSLNGQFELFLLTTDGSNNSDGGASSGFSRNVTQSVPGPAPPSAYPPFGLPQHMRQYSGYDNDFLIGGITLFFVPMPPGGASTMTSYSSDFGEIVQRRQKERDHAFRERYEVRKRNETEAKTVKSSHNMGSTTNLPSTSAEQPNAAPSKRKPRAYVKDRVKSRTKELMENLFATVTRRDSSKNMRRTESQRCCTGLAIVAPSSHSTNDPIIIGSPLTKTRSGWLTPPTRGASGSDISGKALKKSATQTVVDSCKLSVDYLKKSNRLSLVDENGKLRLPSFRSDKKSDVSNVSRSSKSSFRLSGRVMEVVRNGPFSGKKDEKEQKAAPEPPTEEKQTSKKPDPTTTSFKSKSRNKLALNLTMPPQTEPRSPSPAPETPHPPISVTAPTPPEGRKRLPLAFVDLLAAIPPPSRTLLTPEAMNTPTVTSEYTTAEETSPASTVSRQTKPGVETGSLAEIVQARKKRAPRRYIHSHTTSTYDAAANEKVPDASERRKLIGFLHRTSHLSPLVPEGIDTVTTVASVTNVVGNRRRYLEDSTVGTESDARVFSDDESRVSTSTDNITSVSRQHNNYRVRQRRMRRHLRQPSRASSMSSMTETSLALEVMTVTLNMDSVNFLGISIVGQSSTGGDNGIYVANIMKGGAVALDGRIQPGDMILQVNDTSFENFSNDQAVEVLKEAVVHRGPIKLTVAKSDTGRFDAFNVPSEPVRPIDMRAWIQHTNAANNLPHIPEGSEGAPTPIPGQYPHNYGRAPSSSTATSNGSNGHTILGPNGQVFILPKKLDLSTDRKRVVSVMALPNSGLDIKDRTWLKIPIPMSFLGSDLVEWLIDHVEGLCDRKEAKKYATDLLKEGYITHMVNGNKFSEQSYYMIGRECSDAVRLRLSEEGASRSDVASSLPAPPPHLAPQPWTANSAMVGHPHHPPQMPQQGGRLLVATPNSTRKSPVLNGVPNGGGNGAYPTSYAADNSSYGVIGGVNGVAAPPPTWRLTEESLGSLRHMADV